MFFLNDINVEFARGKDKKKRKRPSIRKGILKGAGYGAAIGGGLGLTAAALTPGLRRVAIPIGIANAANYGILGGAIGGGINAARKYEYDRK